MDNAELVHHVHSPVVEGGKSLAISTLIASFAAFPYHPPNRIRQIIRDDQRAGRVDRHAHRAASGLAVFVAKAGDEVDGVA